MTLIKSISGIRGTIGGRHSENLTPQDVMKFTSAFALRLKKRFPNNRLCVVIGRDARVSGEMISGIVSSTLSSFGVDVIDLGLSTTPTVELAVTAYHAQGGIILTASHNPADWNALKLLDEKGEFLSADAGQEILQIADQQDFEYAWWDGLGKIEHKDSFIKQHVDAVVSHALVNSQAIHKAGFKIVVDAVDSTGGIAVPMLLEALGVDDVVCLNCEPTGMFSHNPEPLPEHLKQISETIRLTGADLGIVVDPDVDRLALVCEDGKPFGEEYTLVAVADYILRHRKGPVVSNLSSSKALGDVAARFSQKYYASSVGEVNVVAKMKEVGAIVGGEGNGGIIIPDFHYGRDALIGIALILTHLAIEGVKASELRNSYPNYFIDKSKLQLDSSVDVDDMLKRFVDTHKDLKINTIDGIKIDAEDHWVHIRKSNTEPILRIYVEASDSQLAGHYSDYWKKTLLKNL